MAEVNEEVLLVGTIFDSKLIACATVTKFLEDQGYKTIFDAHPPNKKKDPDYILHRYGNARELERIAIRILELS